VTKIAEVLQHSDGLGADNLLQLLKKLVPQLPGTPWYLVCWTSVSITLLTQALDVLTLSSSASWEMLWAHKLLGSSTTGLWNCNLCECNLRHEEEQFHQKFSWQQDGVSLLGKEILWLWNGERAVSLKVFLTTRRYLFQGKKYCDSGMEKPDLFRSSDEEEFCLNMNMVATWDQGVWCAGFVQEGV